VADLFHKSDNIYQSVYQSLQEVRELFHREGRISDSNAKLDETVKLLSIHYAATRNLIGAREYATIRDLATFDLSNLQSIFQKVASEAPFIDHEGSSIFGPRPHLAFESGDERVAFELFVATGRAFLAHKNGAGSFDVLNEAFGHHVRDNFRSHIEDAQYMTPPEVVDFIVKTAAQDLLAGQTFRGRDKFIMMDPACGVGSFISAWSKEYNRARAANKQLPPLIAVGQDKVERMARLAMMNLIFSGRREDRISFGNSLFDGSAIDFYNGKVDLILTNPPFGAKFPRDEVLLRGRKSTPIFAEAGLSARTIDSELLFIDRYLSLLRDGGCCLVVVPDGVISAKGVPAFLRQHLARVAVLRGIIELPPVTFAQAGTRTKTAVLYFEKRSTVSSGPTRIFFGEVDDLGFEVAKRKGVPIKRSEGNNQLPVLLEALAARSDRPTDKTGRSITAIWREIDPTRQESWTPRQFRVDDGQVRNTADENNYSLRKLGDLVEPRVHRRPERYRAGTFFISVLHVIGEGVLDIAGVKRYRPITPGLPVVPGEIIISRINPRIPRVLVVPDLGGPILCSSEFEILRARKNVSPFALAYVLMSGVAQEQIHALTAGTSASHSRVKAERLYGVQIPWPTAPQDVEEFDSLADRYGKAMENLVKSIASISELRELENGWREKNKSLM